jgi:hypothetical protein
MLTRCSHGVSCIADVGMRTRHRRRCRGLGYGRDGPGPQAQIQALCREFSKRRTVIEEVMADPDDGRAARRRWPPARARPPLPARARPPARRSPRAGIGRVMLTRQPGSPGLGAQWESVGLLRAGQPMGGRLDELRGAPRGSNRSVMHPGSGHSPITRRRCHAPRRCRRGPTTAATSPPRSDPRAGRSAAVGAGWPAAAAAVRFGLALTAV